MLKDPEEMAKFGSKAVVGSGEARLELRIGSSMKASRFLGAEGSWEGWVYVRSALGTSRHWKRESGL